MPTPSIVLFIIFGFCVLLQIAFRVSPVFADFYNRHIGGIFRFLMAKATDWIPFSLAEGLLYLMPVAVIVFCVKLFQNIRGETGSGNCILCKIVSKYPGRNPLFCPLRFRAFIYPDCRKFYFCNQFCGRVSRQHPGTKITAKRSGSHSRGVV